MSKMFDIITVGSATIDCFATTENKYVKKHRFCYPEGSKILLKKLIFNTGGGGTNTAVSLARLGFKTAFIGKFGSKHNATLILDQLKKECVYSLVKCDKNDRTAFSIILNAEHADRAILLFKGSSDKLKYKEIPKNKLKTRYFYFASMDGQSFRTMKKLANFAETKKIPICFNPSSYMIKKENILPVVKKSKILILNYNEAKLLTKKNRIEEQLKVLKNLGPELVVITEGKKGASCYNGKNKYVLKITKESNVVETTGAGDAFASGFFAGVIKRKDIPFALKLGLANASSILKHYGAKEKLLSWKKALKIINKLPCKIIIKKL
ncbi:hypothetical protein DRJ17_03640 [Candidatus Woesearchaeota archaeon]|nr:MAG: hypothetical protein DRJ17_03640 [Candidatus Woesearchaeota archaeon]